MIPCGILRLRRRSGMLRSAKSLSHASLLVSVRVTRGGGLKVQLAVIVPRLCLCWSVETNNVERICNPDLCLRLVHKVGRALLLALVADGFSHEPCFVVSSLTTSSG